MITQASHRLRDLIRNDEVVCYCDVHARTERGEEGHETDCVWLAAVRMVYAEERRVEGQ